jgi:nucleotide-binding universal stress UspA family protein
MTESGRNYLDVITSRSRPTVVAVDFSGDSRAALAWACAFSDCAGGDLVVLHVVHDPAGQPGYYRENRDKPLQTQEQAAAVMLDDFLASVKRDYPELTRLETAEKILLSGLPPGRIVEASERLNAKLIVIGSRGMTGLPHLMQGSVSERVVVLAGRPVVVVKSADGQHAQKIRKRAEKERKKAEKARKKQEKKAQKSA